jgi:flagellar M-ring protein FliF
MDKLQAIAKQISAFWAGLPTPKRIALVGLTTLALAITLFVSYVGSQVHYAYLYTGLESQDAAGIVEKLKTMQVPFQLAANGTAIQVPEERVAALRLELAAAGLPHGGGVGFELFDRTQIGATEFEQQVNLRRALEGELVRSILTIDGVQAARVHLVMPERRLFVAREQQASASVVLKLRNPAGFSQREVAGIVHLVSAAVPNLHRDRVSVVSTDGITLHRPNTGTGDTGSAGDQSDNASEHAHALAGQMENDVRAQIERIVGPGNADVRVNLKLDTSAREKVEEHYEPSKTALRSEQKVQELSGTGQAGVAGVPGALTNLPDARQAGADVTEAPGGGDGAVSRLSQTRNWEVDKVSQKTTTPPGSIDKLSVAVLVNDHLERRGKQWVNTPRTAQELTQIEELVKRAVGFSVERGDSVHVAAASFAHLDADTEVGSTEERGWKKFLPYLIAGLVGLVALAAVVLVWRRRRKGSKAMPLALMGQGFGANAELPGHLAGMSDANGLPAANFASIEGLSGSHKLDSPALRSRALQFASDDPATAAIIIRKWLNAGATNATAAR